MRKLLILVIVVLFLTCMVWAAKVAYVYQQEKNRIKWPEYFPLIRDLQVANKKIYILTFKSIDT